SFGFSSWVLSDLLTARLSDLLTARLSDLLTARIWDLLTARFSFSGLLTTRAVSSLLRGFSNYLWRGLSVLLTARLSDLLTALSTYLNCDALNYYASFHTYGFVGLTYCETFILFTATFGLTSARYRSNYCEISDLLR
ncbi:hypothetical protein L9F63_024952, partial [Diploptera punctata]